MCRRTISVAHSFCTMYVFGVDVSKPAINFAPVIWNNRLTRPPDTQHWYSIDDWFAFNSFNTMHSPFYTPFIVHRWGPPQRLKVQSTYALKHVFAVKHIHHHRTDWLDSQPSFTRLHVSARIAHIMYASVHFWRADTLPLRLIRISCRTERSRIFAWFFFAF